MIEKCPICNQEMFIVVDKSVPIPFNIGPFTLTTEKTLESHLECKCGYKKERETHEEI